MIALEKEPEWSTTKIATVFYGDKFYRLVAEGRHSDSGKYSWAVTTNDMENLLIAYGNDCADLTEAMDCTEIALRRHLDNEGYYIQQSGIGNGKKDPRGRHQYPPYGGRSKKQKEIERIDRQDV